MKNPFSNWKKKDQLIGLLAETKNGEYVNLIWESPCPSEVVKFCALGKIISQGVSLKLYFANRVFRNNS